MYLLVLAAAAACVLACACAARLRRSRLTRAVRRYPACFPELPVLGPFYRFMGNEQGLMKTMIELGRSTIELGGVSRLCGLGFSFLVLTDASDATEVLKFYLNKDDSLYSVVRPITRNGSVFLTDARQSRARRQVLLPAFSPRRLAGYMRAVWAQSARLADALRPHAGAGPFRLPPHLGALCFDNIIAVAGVEELKEEFHSGEISSTVTRCFQLAVRRWVSLWMQPKVLHRLTGNYREMDRLVTSLFAFTDRAQEIRRNKLEKSHLQQSDENSIGDKEETIEPGIFDSLLGSGLSRSQVCEEMVVMFGAADEAGLTIQYALLLLGQYPAVQARLHRELSEVFGDSDRPFVKEDLTKTPYLDMVLKEVMRLYPPVPLVMRKAHTEKTLSSGRVIPAGAGIFIPIYSLHRNPKYWGADAEHFDPERFLPARLAAVPDHAYMPFSAGPRGCPGYKLGYYFVKLGLCAVLRRYRVVGAPAPGPAPHIPTKYEVTMRPVCEYIELVNRD